MGIAATLQDILLPPCCAACDAYGQAPLCDDCEDIVRWIGDDSCLRCGLPSLAPVGVCGRCAGIPFGFARAAASALYSGPIRDVVVAYKGRGERRRARTLARWMIPAAARLGRPGVITWVPSTKRAKRARGFDHAEELARAFGAEVGLAPVALLEKLRETQDQAALDRRRRAANLDRAFAARSSPELVLLIDDVLTTGATASACADALREAGARRVEVLTLARTP